jgi:hypothetical protein
VQHRRTPAGAERLALAEHVVVITPVARRRFCRMAPLALVLLLADAAAARVAGKPAAATTADVAPSASTPTPAVTLPQWCDRDAGTLTISLLDGSTGGPAPARVEIVDQNGEMWIVPGSITVGGDCGGHATAAAGRSGDIANPMLDVTSYVRNPYDGAFQFYLDAEGTVALPPGRYRVRASKGLEFTPATQQVTITAGSTTHTVLTLARWIDMASLGWFSADDHLHIARRDASDDRRIARWMQAEDVNVANLLQMGILPGVLAANQYAFGPRNVYQDGDTIVASGQENPRTWILGHGIILGASSYIDFPANRLVYGDYWQAAARDDALRGYAHWGTLAARDGLAIDAPAGNIDFIEVLQSDIGNYEALYQILGLGFRMTPTAGTDYPCALTNLPGRDRFYTHVDGPLTYDRWLNAIRRGRTFVTDGPLVTDFRVGDAQIGDDLSLPAPATLPVHGTVRFDPGRDDVTAVELVRNGEIVHVVHDRSAPGEIRMETTLDVTGGSWIALRAFGRKVDVPATMPRTSSAHTGPIYVAVGGAGVAGQESARRLAEAELSRLAQLEQTLERDATSGPPQWVGATRAETEHALPALRSAIAAARKHFEAIAHPPS